jgi:hypothetical protein
MIPPLFGKQEVGIWRVKKRFPNRTTEYKNTFEKNPGKHFHYCILKKTPIYCFCSDLNFNFTGKVIYRSDFIFDWKRQEVGIWWVQKGFPRYGVPIWSLWPNIRVLPSIVAEKNASKNEHICSMYIKINKVGKQEVGIWRVKKRFPRYGVPIHVCRLI